MNTTTGFNIKGEDQTRCQRDYTMKNPEPPNKISLCGSKQKNTDETIKMLANCCQNKVMMLSNMEKSN